MRARALAALLHWRDNLSLERTAAALLFIAIGAVACLMPIQSDTWWQLRAGQDFWQSGAIPLVETYSHTADGRFWMNHEWLSEVLFYGLYRVGGLPLLTGVAAGVVIVGIVMSWSLMTGSTLVKLVLLAGSVMTLSIAWTPRPHIFTLLLLTVCMRLLASDRYMWLPPLLLVWANLHGGFTLGILIVGGAVVAAVPAGLSVVRTRLLVLGLCAGVTLVTPLGLAFWEELPASLARLREYQVLEWRRASLTNVTLLPFWIGAVALLVLSLRHWRHLQRVSTDRVITIGAVLLIPLGLISIRNIPPFLLLAMPAISRLLAVGMSPERERPVDRTKANVHASIVGVVATAVIIVVTTAWLAPWPRLGWTPVPRPVLDAVATCQGPLYNSYDDGGYLVWFAPERKVFIDSRQDPYPVEIVRQDMRVQLDGDYRDVFAEHRVQCAFVRTGALIAQRLNGDGWTSLYSGPTWSVYER